MSYAIAAAGTGGHIYPALAVAEELVASGVPRHDIVFFGGDRLEKTAIPDAGFELVSVEMRGLARKLSLANAKLPYLVYRASRRLRRELRKRRVRSLLVMGGYITVPAVRAARGAGIPYVVHEQNGRPGLANRLAARGAARVLVAFPAAAAKLKGAAVVGNPLRRALVEFDRTGLRRAARRRYEMDPEGQVLGVMGGSQGAASINEAVARVAEQGVAIVHLTGATHATTMAEQAKGAQIPWHTVPFESAMEDFYAACDLVVARAGASTISELAATGTPSVLIPLQAVGQEHNARLLEGAGAAIVLPQADLDELPALVTELLDAPQRLHDMGESAKAVSHPAAASDVAQVVMDVGRG